MLFLWQQKKMFRLSQKFYFWIIRAFVRGYKTTITTHYNWMYFLCRLGHVLRVHNLQSCDSACLQSVFHQNRVTSCFCQWHGSMTYLSREGKSGWFVPVNGVTQRNIWFSANSICTKLHTDDWWHHDDMQCLLLAALSEISRAACWSQTQRLPEVIIKWS